MTTRIGSPHAWPRLRVEGWTATRDTLHMWTQILGKIRLSHPLLNHWWQVTLYVSPRGLTTGAIPYRGGSFDLELDFVEHRLRVRSSAGEERLVALTSRPVTDFYAATMRALDDLGIDVVIDARPRRRLRTPAQSHDQRRCDHYARTVGPEGCGRAGRLERANRRPVGLRRPPSGGRRVRVSPR